MWIGIIRTDGSAKHSRSNELTKGCEYYAEPIRISTVCRSGYVIIHHTAFRRADQPKRARHSHLGDGGLLLQFYRAKRRCPHGVNANLVETTRRSSPCRVSLRRESSLPRRIVVSEDLRSHPVAGTHPRLPRPPGPSTGAAAASGASVLRFRCSRRYHP